MLLQTTLPIALERLRRACIEMIRPIRPSSIACLASATRGSKRQMCPTMKSPRLCRAASRIRSQSSTRRGHRLFQQHVLAAPQGVDGDVAVVLDVRGDARPRRPRGRPGAAGSRCSASSRDSGRRLPPSAAAAACRGPPARSPASRRGCRRGSRRTTPGRSRPSARCVCTGFSLRSSFMTSLLVSRVTIAVPGRRGKGPRGAHGERPPTADKPATPYQHLCAFHASCLDTPVAVPVWLKCPSHAGPFLVVTAPLVGRGPRLRGTIGRVGKLTHETPSRAHFRVGCCRRAGVHRHRPGTAEPARAGTTTCPGTRRHRDATDRLRPRKTPLPRPPSAPRASSPSVPGRTPCALAPGRWPPIPYGPQPWPWTRLRRVRRSANRPIPRQKRQASRPADPFGLRSREPGEPAVVVRRGTQDAEQDAGEPALLKSSPPAGGTAVPRDSAPRKAPVLDFPPGPSRAARRRPRPLGPGKGPGNPASNSSKGPKRPK